MSVVGQIQPQVVALSQLLAVFTSLLVLCTADVVQLVQQRQHLVVG